jgi:glyoxylase-like metal-dependent hydrolase (beta-lactamase superfamily II)
VGGRVSRVALVAGEKTAREVAVGACAPAVPCANSVVAEAKVPGELSVRPASWWTGDVLVDCGPATALDNLLEALGDRQPRALLLTHIHFDHAGAAGALVERWPELEVWVHRRGARHLAAPERLEASARRVFGAATCTRCATSCRRRSTPTASRLMR